MEKLLSVKNITKTFPIKTGLFENNKGFIRAVDNITLDINFGETFGLVGESGCGKSTLARTILKLVEPTSGQIIFEENNITNLNRKEMRKYRRDMSMIFQKPYSALNPRQTLREIISAPLIVQKKYTKKEINDRTDYLIDLVGLNINHLDKYPHEFSGGQRQRIMIARAISLNPKLIICDEPVSALDVSIQSQILNLLTELQEKFNLTYLFVSHDLSVVNYISDRIAVMYLGSIVELAESDELYKKPMHPYTVALFSAIPTMDIDKKKDRIILEGDLPTNSEVHKGCKFATRCQHVMSICNEQYPEFLNVGNNHYVACHLYKDGGKNV